MVYKKKLNQYTQTSTNLSDPLLRCSTNSPLRIVEMASFSSKLYEGKLTGMICPHTPIGSCLVSVKYSPSARRKEQKETEYQSAWGKMVSNALYTYAWTIN